MIDVERLARAIEEQDPHTCDDRFRECAKAIGSAYARLSAEQPPHRLVTEGLYSGCCYTDGQVWPCETAQPQVIEGYIDPSGKEKGNWWKG